MASPLSLEELADLPRPGVLCTVVKVTGSAPQRPGARMWASADAFLGTVGGGRFELEVLAHARGLLASLPEPHLKEYVLCKESGQCCGGRVEVFFEPAGRGRVAHLFGAGHVGRALAQVLSGMPFRTVVVDPRPEWADPKTLPAGVEAVCGDPVAYAAGRAWGPEDAVCVFTHSHDLDLELLRRLLPAGPGYLGLIGSEHKAEVFRARLKAGLSAAQAAALDELWEARVRCPMGEPSASKNPKVIAVAVAAELLKAWALPATAPAPRALPIPPAPRPA